jgi:hypothetical protein
MIDAKVSVNGASQIVKGKTYYVAAKEAYVYMK